MGGIALDTGPKAALLEYLQELFVVGRGVLTGSINRGFMVCFFRGESLSLLCPL